MARGASGVWLRAVCRLGLLCRGTVYLLVGYLAILASLLVPDREDVVIATKCYNGTHDRKLNRWGLSRRQWNGRAQQDSQKRAENRKNSGEIYIGGCRCHVRAPMISAR